MCGAHDDRAARTPCLHLCLSVRRRRRQGAVVTTPHAVPGLSMCERRTSARFLPFYGAARVLYALALLGAPGRTASPWLGSIARAPAGKIAIRGLGARDLALTAGALDARRKRRSAAPWLWCLAACDAVDLTSTLMADEPRLPPRSKRSTAITASIAGSLAIMLSIGLR